jgi:hypothetical protein
MMMFQAFRQRLLGVGMLVAVSMPLLSLLPNVHGFSSVVVVLPAMTPTKQITTESDRRRRQCANGVIGRTRNNSAVSFDCTSSGSNNRCRSSFLTAARDGTTGITTAETTDNYFSASECDDDPTTLQKDHSHWSLHLLSSSLSEQKSRRKSLAVVLGYCSSILVNSAVVMNRAHATTTTMTMTTDSDQGNIQSRH